MEAIMIKQYRHHGFFRWPYLLLFLAVIFTVSPLSAEVIKNPKPTHYEKNYTELQFVTTIGDDEHDDIFLVRPTSLVVDDEGNLYVYDAMFKKIFKYGRDLKFIKFFGRQGRGPGEIHGGTWELHKLYFGKDKHIYVSDLYNRKIIVFSKDGALVKEIRIHPAIQTEFRPVVDKEGNYYAFTNKDGVIEKISPDNRVVKSFLTDTHTERFVFFEPEPPKHHMAKDFWTDPTLMNIFYDILPDGRFVIFIINSSTLYIFKNDGLTATYPIWPDNAMKTFKYMVNKANNYYKGQNSRFPSYIPMLTYSMIDQDEDNIFYLLGIKDVDGRAPIYKFNAGGSLLGVFYTDSFISFQAKKNYRFYGIAKRKIFVYQEVKK
jgi:hypothetical protein